MAVDLSPTDRFADRHIGPSEDDLSQMLKAVGAESLDQLIQQTIPDSIRLDAGLSLPPAKSEHELLAHILQVADSNAAFRSFIGMGYHDTLTPPVIQRGILENPSWYTQYTPYQAEISQGRLQALLNFQTLVTDLTGLEMANASLLDEGTAAAEAMTMLFRKSRNRDTFFIDVNCHPQTIAVVRSRAEPLGISIRVGDHRQFTMDEATFGVLVQYPGSDGAILDFRPLSNAVHDGGGHVVVAADLLSLLLLEAPAEFGADVVVGSSQRFGVPMGFGGPHAAFFATHGTFKRAIPGRLIGVTVDADGQPALRMALQTREQHIRRDKATSNICTAQVLLAVAASMYAVYHGPEGLRRIATRIHHLARLLAGGLEQAGIKVRHDEFFDTIRVDVQDADLVCARALDAQINLRYFDDGSVGIALDEATTREDVVILVAILSASGEAASGVAGRLDGIAEAMTPGYGGEFGRTTPYLEHPVFNAVHSETQMLRYMLRLASKDLSLTTSMIPLGSCTMKLNATAEMMPITWASLARVHPFAPDDQVAGYRRIVSDLQDWLGEITGLPNVSLQPNSGAAGEYAGLLAIRGFLRSKGEFQRNVCLIPSSAHGTNPASAVMAGMKVVVVRCDDRGNVDLEDLRLKAEEHAEHLAALMITYPSTHGVFETGIRGICELIHLHGGQVYMDGANMNAQVGLCRPGDFGADVCHLNLHKTFAIPHGGGGPGIGPICAADHLAGFLPGDPLLEAGGGAMGPVASARYGSAGVLVISWAYIAMLGAEGLRKSSQVAILSANYMATRLEGHFEVLFKGEAGRVAHEFILDLRSIRQNTSLTEVDVAKRLMDYGFHAPTMSWPVVGTVMIEPTESESKSELDRFCEAMISIRSEIQEVELGIADQSMNVLSQAPHTARMVFSDDWDAPYSREKAAFPAPWTRENKFWPSVRRVNDAHGDRTLICTCPPVEAYQD
jgi:glycine cleavage system P protein (glycine dehydrogenase)